MKDLSFGEKTLRLSSGELIKIPSVIRCLAPSTVIKQYLALCEEENVKPLGTSTLYKIMNECSAVIRKSIKGLDNYVMEGCRAFATLEGILSKIADLTAGDRQTMKEGLQNGKRHLKSDLKVHVTRESATADHCLQFALSSTEHCFQAACNHQHQTLCADCNNLDEVLMLLEEAAQKDDTWQSKESVMYSVEAAVMAIKKWKAHIIRSVNQDKARSTLVESLGDDEVIITCDWAMKFLPRKYREGQVDWFRKRGISWHIAVSLLKCGTTFSTITHVHIFESPISQDAAITAEILIEVGRDLMTRRPHIKKLHYFSDNAGCYKSTATLLLMKKELADNMKSYNFCEAQNGKGPCDLRAANLKAIIRKYLNEGNNVTTAREMKQAISQAQKEDILVKVSTTVNILDVQPAKKFSIAGIAQFFNFKFENDGIRMWKAFDIGSGKLLVWRKVEMPEKTVEVKNVEDWGAGDLQSYDKETDNDDSQQPTQSKKTTVFECPKEGCVRLFSSTKALDEHILIGNCHFEGSSKLVSEKAKQMYSKKVKNLFPQKYVQIANMQEVPCQELIKKKLFAGWATKEPKAQSKFNDCQKKFMIDKFNIGKTTGKKVDPYVAAEEMRTCGKFKRSEFLSGQQITSYFSRQQDRSSCKEDPDAADEEDRKDLIRSKVKSLLKSD